MLSLRNVSVRYGKSEVVHGVTMNVPEGTTTGLIGANGAGKSTIMKAISGIHPLSGGEIWFDDLRLDRLPGHLIVKAGVVQVPEGRRLFPEMTVAQNLRIGAFLRSDKGQVREDLERVFERFPRLRERRKQRADTLSGGEQQMLAIGRALMAKPKLLLLDEPSLGLAPLVIQHIAEVIRAVNADGISVLLVEQNAGLAFGVTDKSYVLEVGRITLEGTPQDLMDKEVVRKAFIGG